MWSWWNDLDKISAVSSWLVGLTAALTLFAAFVGLAAWKVGDRVSALRDTADDKYRKETEKQIANAHAEASAAIKATAIAQLETERLKNANLQLQQQLAKMAPRRVSADQSACFKSNFRFKLSNLNKIRITSSQAAGCPT